MSRHNLSQERILREQGIERERQREERRDRICRAAQANPDMTLSAVGKRFGMSGKHVGRLLQERGLARRTG